MDMGEYSEDQLDQLLIQAESEIATWRAVEMAVVAEKRRRKSHHAEVHRSIVDWVAARADVSHETARRICWTGSRLLDAPEVALALAGGNMSFDWAELLARVPKEHRVNHEAFDIGQLRRRVAHHRRLTRRRERIAGRGFLNVQARSDELMTALWGELHGVEGRIVEKAVDQRADEVVPTDAGLSVAERRALAMVAICQDSLYTEGHPEAVPAEVLVTVDGRTAAEAGGEAGLSVLAGPRVGPRMLEEIMCNGRVDVLGVTETGEPLSLGRRSRTVSRKLRRFVLDRDGGCTADGCPSNYRLEVHHVVPWSHGGRTDAESLITLCRFHHHVSVHREGMQIVRIGPSRVRL